MWEWFQAQLQAFKSFKHCFQTRVSYTPLPLWRLNDTVPIEYIKNLDSTKLIDGKSTTLDSIHAWRKLLNNFGHDMIILLTPVFTVESSQTKKVKERHKIRYRFELNSTCVILLSCFNLCWLYQWTYGSWQKVDLSQRRGHNAKKRQQASRRDENGRYSGISRIKQSLNSRILKENSAQDKSLKVVSGMRLVRESVGNKSATFYWPCLKLGSIQSEAVLTKGIHRKNFKQMALRSLTTVHWTTQKKISVVKVHMATCIMATMTVCLLLLNSLNATICMNSS